MTKLRPQFEEAGNGPLNVNFISILIKFFLHFVLCGAVKILENGFGLISKLERSLVKLFFFFLLKSSLHKFFESSTRVQFKNPLPEKEQSKQVTFSLGLL